MKRYFVTGTDTDCGKTFVTNQLVNYFSSSAAIKPIASGCEYSKNQLVNSDALLHQQQNHLPLKLLIPGDLDCQFRRTYQQGRMVQVLMSIKWLIIALICN